MFRQIPEQQGLYYPEFEKGSCGVGFVANINGESSDYIVKQGIEVLRRLAHRGAVGADPDTGDGAGILIQMPHDFLFNKAALDLGIKLPELYQYGSGLVFLPNDDKERDFCKNVFQKVAENEGQTLLGWRRVPVNNTHIGESAKSTEPVFEQVFIARGRAVKDDLDFERKLYVIRREIENVVLKSSLKEKGSFYITNISSRTLSYKGLLTPEQVEDFFLDLKDEDLKSAICLVHSRYSTNTFPSWNLAQPFRLLAHNGEINTLRGNINWVSARERLLNSSLFGSDIEKIKPIILKGGSDSAAIDNIFELLVLSGRSLEHAMMMLIPEAWEHNDLMDSGLREFYKYHACFMEPWDGPAAIAFTDGKNIGAVLDRNGLRPARYIITKSGFVVMASEVGVLDIEPAEIEISGRLEPGKIFFIDTERGFVVHDHEIKKQLSSQREYAKWNKDNMVDIDGISAADGSLEADYNIDDILARLSAFGYSREDFKAIFKPMIEDGKEPVGSMGNDTPYAFLSRKPLLLYDYFRQLFAQVTNPAIDPIRERLVMSIESFVGPSSNILEESSEHSHKLRVKNPILNNDELSKIVNISIDGFKAKKIYSFFDSDSSVEGFINALDRICFEAEYAVESGYSFIILSDRGTDKDNVALPALLAISAVHHHLVNKTIRSQVALVVESAEPREVHHFALLFGYGADCVNPYLAYRAIRYMIDRDNLSIDLKKALSNYNKALREGLLKILSKMGISTLRSYRGAQIFEILGLDNKLTERYFSNTISRIGGVGIKIIAEETIKRHKDAYSDREPKDSCLSSGGIYQWRIDGESHLWNPESILTLQIAARNNDYKRYKEFAAMINDQKESPATLRSLFKFNDTESITIDRVEPVESIMKRFATGAMSFGSISRAAHETIAVAMNRIGGKSNTGEGGEDPGRFFDLPSGDSKRSSIKQVASGRFGVTLNYLVNADEIQIKISQGAKPGEGGQLPGHKVSDIIARTRYTTPGVTLISPPPHHDIYSIEDLAQLIFDLKNVNPEARISVKLVSEVGVGTVAAGVAKCYADMILISGGDGGTGAAPKSSIRYAGLPWELGLSETHQTLLLNNLRSRVRLQVDGQMRTGRDLAIATLLGAEEYGFCSAVLVTMGCVMLRHCHLNSCSVGIATQDEILQKRFQGRPDHIVNYLTFVAEEFREIMAKLGIKSVDEMVGRTELLSQNDSILSNKSKNIDYSKILYKPKVLNGSSFDGLKRSNIGLDKVLDRKLIKDSVESIGKNKVINIKSKIKNTDRAVGAMLSGEICRKYGDNALLEDSIICDFQGIAGQSFGAFLMKGITFRLQGMANDYIGKGISGGKIIVYPERGSSYDPGDNVIIGNTSFYGAISGEAYINGVAGERFSVRNSGLYAVVEGVGDHGCEYMTGGRIIVLGKTGRNFAAGMSGGIAYVYDYDNSFKFKCNRDMVELESVEIEDIETLYFLLNNHIKYTNSSKASYILNNIKEERKKFIKIMPLEYKRVLDNKRLNSSDILESSDG